MEETLTEYLRILEPITTKHQHERTKAITKNFAAGLGPHLQQYLEDKREAENNWVSYLSFRLRLKKTFVIL